jgi:hypothetical protein
VVDASGVHIMAITFAADQFAYANNPTVLNALTDKVTFMCWVYPTTLSGWWPAFSRQIGTTGDEQIFLGFNVDQPQMFINTVDNGNQGVNGSAVTTGSWYHLCATYSGARTELFVNGASVANDTTWTGNLTTTNRQFIIGGNNNNANTPPTPEDTIPGGLVEDIRVYNRVLTNNEIVSIAFGMDNIVDGMVLAYGLNEDALATTPTTIKCRNGVDNATCSGSMTYSQGANWRTVCAGYGNGC